MPAPLPDSAILRLAKQRTLRFAALAEVAPTGGALALGAPTDFGLFNHPCTEAPS